MTGPHALLRRVKMYFTFVSHSGGCFYVGCVCGWVAVAALCLRCGAVLYGCLVLAVWCGALWLPCACGAVRCAVVFRCRYLPSFAAVVFFGTAGLAPTDVPKIWVRADATEPKGALNKDEFYVVSQAAAAAAAAAQKETQN